MKHTLLLFLVFVVASCGKKTEQTGTVDTATVQKVAIEPATGSPAYPNAKLVIVSPREGQVLKNEKDSVLVVMQVTGTQLAVPTGGDSTKGIAYSKQGQHVHVIVDDKPYMADYKNGQPFNVGLLPAGLHTIRAFPSYSWHESIKAPESFAARTFYVGTEAKEKTAAANDLKGPLLTYSRPKGEYTGSDTGRVLLDFFVANAVLGPDAYKVKLWIDDAAMPDIVKWQPYFITGLSHGKHTIKLQLVDPKGNAVPGSYNNPSQEITVG
ncbi:MAG: hypothetical protein Q8922_15000 [Bacteroidota bacterium]|nr:hypothetical protein [Bacteroidota bacterium]MDP4234134.1 hypothetical protein [Bacteroidota bacterium]MDP4244071.1 hypothetical protein [Bacteroidota bacterium]MDP4289225.1 hypothetical protein [Bacteroidota bacterium]